MSTRSWGNRLVLAMALALAGLCASAAAAAAATFCVNPAAGQSCSGTPEPTLQSALTAAASPPVNTQRNTVIVGNPGPAPASGYSYFTANPTTNPVDIIGAGPGTTTLTYSGGGSSTVLALSGDGSSVSNLSAVMPGATGGTGIALLGAKAAHVLVSATSPQSSTITGVALLQGSTPTAPLPALTQSAVAFPTGGSAPQTPVAAIVGALIADDGVSGQNASAVVFESPPSGYSNSSTLRRVTVSDPQAGTGTSVGIVVEGQTVSADNVAVSQPGGSGTGSVVGAVVETTGSNDSTLNLNQASFYGDADTSGSTDSLGVIAESGTANRAATANVRNSIFRNFFFGTERSATASGASANVRYDYSDYDVIHQLSTNSSGGSGTTTRGTGDFADVDPGWPNPAAANFALPTGSPVINAGDPAALNPAIESTTDVLGKPRISGARRDMGAVEFQFPPPTLASKGTFNPRNGKVALAATCNEPATDACSFTITVKGKVTKVTRKHGHKHRKRVQVTVVLRGTIVGGTTGTLSGKFSRKALRAIGKAKKLSLSATGAGADRGGTTFAFSQKMTLTRQKVKKR